MKQVIREINNIDKSNNKTEKMISSEAVLTGDGINLEDKLKEMIKEIQTEQWKQKYPVNSLYITMNPNNPVNIFGFGEWQLTAKNQTILGADTETAQAGTVTGSNSRSFTIPSHNHKLASHAHNIAHTHKVNSHSHTVSHNHTVNAHGHTVSNTTLNANQIPSHSHSLSHNNGNPAYVGGGGESGGASNACIKLEPTIREAQHYINNKIFTINNTGGNQGHNHGLSSTALTTNTSSISNTGSSAPSTESSSIATSGASGELTTTSTSNSVINIDTRQESVTVYIWRRIM